jgi:integrase
MKGSIDKYSVKGSSKPRWRYRVYTGKDETGKKLYETQAAFAKEGDAYDAMQKRMGEIATRTNAAPPPEKTLTEWLQTWLDTYAVNRCQPKTLERYRQLARYVTEPTTNEVKAIATAPLAMLKPAILEAGLYALLKIPGQRREHISARTVRHVAGLLNVALNKAFKLDLIPVNPLLKCELPTWIKQDARSLTADEIRRLRETCRGDWTFTLIEVAFATGARRGELLALQWTDMDWVSGILTISKSLEQTAAGLRIKCPKNGKTRLCQLPKSAIVALQFLHDQQKEQRRLFLGDYQDKGLIFCQPDGSFYEPDLISQVIVRRLNKAGIKDASLHSLRHTHTSHLLSKGVPLPAVSARLGHANPNVTARIYSHLVAGDDQRAADVWDSVIDGKVQ